MMDEEHSERFGLLRELLEDPRRPASELARAMPAEGEETLAMWMHVLHEVAKTGRLFEFMEEVTMMRTVREFPPMEGDEYLTVGGIYAINLDRIRRFARSLRVHVGINTTNHRLLDVWVGYGEDWRPFSFEIPNALFGMYAPEEIYAILFKEIEKRQLWMKELLHLKNIRERVDWDPDGSDWDPGGSD